MQEFPNQTIGNYANKKKVEKYYQLVKDGTENEDEGVDANVFKRLKEILPASLREKTVMDLGSGDGRWSKYFNSVGAKDVYALDISETMTKKAHDTIYSPVITYMLSVPICKNSP